MAKKGKKGKGIFLEFKEFINKGNAFMLAVGVVIGGAFGAIVTAFVNILMSLATWAIPGGLKGLVTVLPALNKAQEGFDVSVGLGGEFAKADLQALGTALANKTYGAEVVEANPNLIESCKTTIMSNYTLHGTTYTYNMRAVIDWGTLINSVIAFLIIAVVLFIIVKVVASLQAKKAELEAKALEEHYKKHPEDRPAPVEPGVPAPTEAELLTQIRDLLREKQGK